MATTSYVQLEAHKPPPASDVEGPTKGPGTSVLIACWGPLCLSQLE